MNNQKVVDFTIGSIDNIETDLSFSFAGFEKCLPEDAQPQHIRQFYLIHYCVSGCGYFTDPSGEHEVSPGQIFIIKPGDVVSYRADKADPWEYIWMGFKGRYAERLTALEPVLEYEHDTFFKLRRLCEKEVMSRDAYFSVLFEFFYRAFENLPAKRDVISEVKSYIDFNYMNKLSVAQIAERVHVDRCYLTRKFRERYGMPIQNYMILTRIDNACKFLEDGHSVSDAAYMSGYGDVFNFSKMFKRIKGCAPSEYGRSRRDKAQ